MVEINTSGLRFYSQQDEANLFNWANEIECIASVEKGVFCIDPEKVDESSLRGLIAVLFRYRLPMHNLSVFLNSENKSWFKNPSMYWHEMVFGSEKECHIVKNGESVESFFGYWPMFSDGNITKIALDGPKGSLQVSVFYIDSDKNISAEVGLLFTGVNDMELNEVREHNVLDELIIESSGEFSNRCEVKFVGCCGATGNLFCESVEVEYIHA